MNLADLHYQRSFEKDTQLKISLLIKQFLILTTATASKFTTDPSMFMKVDGQSKDEQGRQYVNGDNSLNSFNNWLFEQTKGGLLPTFDTAVAFCLQQFVFIKCRFIRDCIFGWYLCFR